MENGLTKLVPFDVAKDELLVMAKDYTGLIVTKETFESAKKARAVLREKRFFIQNIEKQNNDNINDLKKQNKENAAELIAIIEPIEKQIDSGIKEIENEKERIKKEKQEAEQRMIQARVQKLFVLGMQFNGIAYTLGEAKINSLEVKELSEEQFNQVTMQVEIEFNKIQETKAEEARKQAEEKASIEAQKKAQQEEKERLNKQAMELEEQKAAALKQQKEIQDKADAEIAAKEKAIKEQQDKIAKEQADKQAEIDRQIKELANAVKQKRNDELRPFIIFIRDYSTMIGMEESVYQKEFDNIKIAAKQHYEYEAKTKQEEIDRAAEKATKEAEAKQKADAEAKLKAEKDAIAEAERQKELMPDKAKLIDLATGVSIFVDTFKLKNKKANNIYLTAKQMFKEVSDQILKSTEAL